MVSLSKILLSAQMLFSPFQGANHTTVAKKHVEIEQPAPTKKSQLKTASYIIASAASITAVIVCLFWIKVRNQAKPTNPKQDDTVSIESLRDPFDLTNEKKEQVKKMPHGDQILAEMIKFNDEYLHKNTHRDVPLLSQTTLDHIEREVLSFEKNQLRRLAPLPANIDDILKDENKFVRLQQHYDSPAIIVHLQNASKNKREQLYKAYGSTEFEQIQQVKIKSEMFTYQKNFLQRKIPNIPVPENMLPASDETQFDRIREYYGSTHQEIIQHFINAARAEKNYLCETRGREGKAEID